MKKIVVGALALAAGWIAWPYYSLYSLGTAINSGDPVAIERRVDWEGVRAGLRDDLKAAMATKLSRSANAGSPESAIGMGFAALLGPAIIDKMVDAYVTPQGIAGLIRNGKVEKGAASPSSGGGINWDRVKYAFFTGPTDFRVDVSGDRDGKDGPAITLAFRWNGDWKLSRVFLPVDELTKGTGR